MGRTKQFDVEALITGPFRTFLSASIKSTSVLDAVKTFNEKFPDAYVTKAEEHVDRSW